MKTTQTILALGILLGLSVGCGSSDDSAKKDIDKDIIDPNSSLNTNFDGKIFSIPSPMQTAMLLEEVKAPFDADLLNPLENIDTYTSEMQKALNLGVYGTDLGYISIYKQNSLSLQYLSNVEKLTSSLGLEGAFDKSFMSRFEKNSTDKDSMMIIVSDAFKKADNYLKSNERKSTSALILVGGWIESLYLACEINKTVNNPKILERIGEQKETLNSIIDILTAYNKGGKFDDLIGDMNDLKGYFDDINITYDFVRPKTIAAKKLTILQHKTKVEVESNTLNFIYQKIGSIRESITA
jgi:hypothetical protein